MRLESPIMNRPKALRLLCFAPFALSAAPNVGAQSPDSVIIATVFGAAMQASIETFEKDTGQFTVRGVALLDIDGDGRPEAFVWLTPTFQQTPTVLVYRLTRSGEPHLLREQLVPGRLEPSSGRLRDPHTLRLAIDMTTQERVSEEKVRSIFLPSGEGLSFVAYGTFVHSDDRNGFVGYTDLTDLKLPAGTLSCEAFEFSRVDALAGGGLVGDRKHRYLVALTQDDVTIYAFNSIRDDDTLDKERWMRARPPGVVGLGTSADGLVELIHADGTREPVAKP